MTLIVIVVYILGRALGRQISGDVEESPQRRRSTVAAHRQLAAAAAAKDVEHVNHPVNEVHKQSHKSPLLMM